MCEIMPASAVAGAVGVDPGLLQMVESEGACHYAWPGGEAQVGPLAVAPSIEEAQQIFETNFGPFLDPDADNQLEEVDVGDRAAYEGGVAFDDDDVLGQVASVRSMMWVLYRNVVIQAGANAWQPQDAGSLRDGPNPEELEHNRDVTLTLGRQLVRYLARHE